MPMTRLASFHSVTAWIRGKKLKNTTTISQFNKSVSCLASATPLLLTSLGHRKVVDRIASMMVDGFEIWQCKILHPSQCHSWEKRWKNLIQYKSVSFWPVKLSKRLAKRSKTSLLMPCAQNLSRSSCWYSQLRLVSLVFKESIALQWLLRKQMRLRSLCQQRLIISK